MKPLNPLSHFRVDPDALTWIGHDLQRPECILAEPNGDLWVADARGGVTHIRPDGQQRFIGQTRDERFERAARVAFGNHSDFIAADSQSSSRFEISDHSSSP